MSVASRRAARRHVAETGLVRLPATERVRLDALFGLCIQLPGSRDVNVFLNDLVREARQVVPSDQCSFYAVRGGRAHLEKRDEAQSASRPPRPRSNGDTVCSAASPAGRVAATGRPVNSTEVTTVPAAAERRVRRGPGGRRSTAAARPVVIPPAATVLAVPVMKSSGETIAVLELANRRNVHGEPVPFTSRDQTALVSLAALAASALGAASLRDELMASHLDAIVRLANAAEFRDGDTGEHIRRMSCYCEAIARRLGRDREWARCILLASPMHDVGKLAIPDSIIKKPAALTADERRLMQQHTVIGAKLLGGSRNEILAMAERIALSHHEHWNGRGYPHGAAGVDIPIEGRIAAVADVFDALTSSRVYKKRMPFEAALREIERNAGRQFDPKVAAAFLASRDEVAAIHEAYRDQ